MIWEEKYSIPSYICDRTDHLALWGMARLFQEVAEHHSSRTGIGFKTMIKKDQVWVLMRMYYHIYHMPAVDDVVTARTWSRGCDGVQFYRDYEMTDAEGNPYITGTTMWVIITYSNRKLCRAKEYVDGYEHHPERQATTRESLRRLIFPKDVTLNMSKEISVIDSMIDHNNHVNNAEYIKMVSNNIVDLNLPNENYCFEINYQQETQYGDKLQLNRVLENDNVWLQFLNSQGISTTAKIYPFVK